MEQVDLNQQMNDLTPGHSPDKNILGFWIYLMTDLISFSVLFATHAVLRSNTFGGPSGKELFNLPFVLGETIILLTSSFTCGLAMLATHAGKKSQAIGWFVVTFLLGATFLIMEFTEFSHLIHEGHGPQANAFLSSFFALVGTHGLHIAVGLLWLGVSMFMVYYRGLTASIVNKLTRFSLFWHFLDIVWIFIFTVVYLMR
jgi:cytochrome o ubiquinol oxidase subunit III